MRRSCGTSVSWQNATEARAPSGVASADHERTTPTLSPSSCIQGSFPATRSDCQPPACDVQLADTPAVLSLKRGRAALQGMSTHNPQPSVTAICLAALLFTGEALAQTPDPSTAPRMKAIVYHNYGSPDVLRLEEIDKPVPNDHQVLVRVRAASVNPLDWHYMRGSPYLARIIAFGLLKPEVTRLGVDYAGTVEAVGRNVTRFKPGDEVFGGRTGAFAEYVSVLEDRAIVLKPANLTFEQAASVPIAGITALQALRDKV